MDSGCAGPVLLRRHKFFLNRLAEMRAKLVLLTPALDQAYMFWSSPTKPVLVSPQTSTGLRLANEQPCVAASWTSLGPDQEGSLTQQELVLELDKAHLATWPALRSSAQIQLGRPAMGGSLGHEPSWGRPLGWDQPTANSANLLAMIVHATPVKV